MFALVGSRPEVKKIDKFFYYEILVVFRIDDTL
jgi:hypothetical protein